MSAPPPADTTTPSYGTSGSEGHSGPRGDDNDVDRMPNRLLWLGLLAIILIVGSTAVAAVAIFNTPSLGIPLTVAVAAVAVVCVAFLLMWAIPAVRSANQRAAAAQHGRASVDAALRRARVELGLIPADATDAELHPSPGRSPAGPRHTYRNGDGHETAHEPGRRAVEDTASGTAQGLAAAAQNVPEWLRGEAGKDAHEDLFVKVMFVKLARRLQSFIGRAIAEIDDLESAYEDPELLRALWRLDHLLTLVRRQAENLAVLGGQSPDRRSTEPVVTHQVLLNANAEIEKFQQVQIISVNLSGASGTVVPAIHGQVAAEVIHLLAELLDNATFFSPPDGPKVKVRANRVAAGLAIEISDCGVGLDFDEQQRINRILDGTEQIDMLQRVHDGRTGLAVVRELAAHHGIKVELQRNIFGGVVAAVVIPPALLVESEATSGGRRAQRALPAATVGPQGPTAPPAPVAPTLTSPSRSPRDREAIAGPAPAQMTRVTSRAIPALDTPSHQPSDWPHAERDDVAFGANDPTSYTTHGHLAPQLPTRQPQHDLADLRAGRRGAAAPGTETFAPATPPTLDRRSSDPAPPPSLPVRGPGTYMPPQLADPVDGTSVTPGHRTDLYAQVRAGRRGAWWALNAPELDDRAVVEGYDTTLGAETPTRDQPRDHSHDSHTTQGDQPRWTT